MVTRFVYTTFPTIRYNTAHAQQVFMPAYWPARRIGGQTQKAASVNIRLMLRSHGPL